MNFQNMFHNFLTRLRVAPKVESGLLSQADLRRIVADMVG
jgi:hypothetical protein